MKLNKSTLKAAGSIAMCVIAGVSAFCTTRDNQQQEKTIKDLVEKVAKLEGKES